jgi:hypothetical protein
MPAAVDLRLLRAAVFAAACVVHRPGRHGTDKLGHGIGGNLIGLALHLKKGMKSLTNEHATLHEMSACSFYK